MEREIHRIILCLLVVWVTVAAARILRNHYELRQLPPPVIAAVEATFPHAYQSHVEKQIENGHTVHIVYLQQDGKTYQISVAPDGTVVHLTGCSIDTDR